MTDFNASEPQIDGFYEDDLREYVVSRPDYYIKAFRAISDGTKQYNWCCALFTPYWLIYRKLWKPAILYVIFFSLLNNSCTVFLGMQGYILASCFQLIFCFGIMGKKGNVMYFDHVKYHLMKEGLSDLETPDYAVRSTLSRKGGVSYIYLFALLLFNSAFQQLLSAMWI